MAVGPWAGIDVVAGAGLICVVLIEVGGASTC
jgi:hypothetical protein